VYSPHEVAVELKYQVLRTMSDILKGIKMLVFIIVSIVNQHNLKFGFHRPKRRM
jgi:hypothetical protein